MLLQLKTSELGGRRNPSPQVQRVFKSPGKIGLNDFMKNTNKCCEKELALPYTGCPKEHVDFVKHDTKFNS